MAFSMIPMQLGQRMQGAQQPTLADMLGIGQQVAKARGQMMLGDLMKRGVMDYNQLGQAMTMAAGPEAGMNVYDPTQRAYKDAMAQSAMANAQAKLNPVAKDAAVKPIAPEQLKTAARYMGTSVDDIDWKDKRTKVVASYPQADTIIPADFSEQNKADMIALAEGTYAGAKESREGQKMGLAVEAGERAKAKEGRDVEKDERDKEADQLALLQKKWSIASDIGRQVNAATDDARNGLVKTAQFYNTIGSGNKPLVGQEAAAAIRQFMLAMEPNSAVMQGEYDAVKGASELLATIRAKAGINSASDVDAKSNDVSWLSTLVVDATSIQQMKKVMAGIERINKDAIAGKLKLGESVAKRFGLKKSDLLMFDAMQQMRGEKNIQDLGGGVTLEQPEAQPMAPIPSASGKTTFKLVNP